MMTKFTAFYVTAATALLVAAQAGPVRAGQAPSFPCAKATSDAEKAICASNRLAQADVAVARAYKSRQRDLAPATAASLATDEKYFLESREYVFGFGDKTPGETLLKLLTDRVQFLHSLRVPSPDRIEGDWSNVTGDVKVEARGDGSFHVAIDTNEPVVGRWVCSTEGTGQFVHGVLEIKIADDGSTVTLSRDGQMLQVQAAAPPNASEWTPDYCGRNGSVDGNYFSVPSPAQ